MGSWFSNLQIRKTEKISGESICDCVVNILAEREYIRVESSQDADITVAVAETRNSQWITVCSGIFAHDDPGSCRAVAITFASTLQTDVLGISCFDSDYLYLNLINSEEPTDAWLGIGKGKDVGITRRNNLTAWKKKVANYPAFSAAAKGEYACADAFLSTAECCLDLPMEQAALSLDSLQSTTLLPNAQFLYFQQKEGKHRAGPQLQVCNLRYALPCFDGMENSVSFINAGDEFFGFSVYFLGPYVEHEEIMFSDVKLKRFQQPSIALTLKKIHLPDGQWAYCCHEPEILFPPGVPRRMKKEKRYQLVTERMREISFVPHGNPRRMLDITVVIIPDGNPDNQARWNVWEQYGSKEEFIKHHNKVWKQVRAMGEDPEQCLPFLKIEDFVE